MPQILPDSQFDWLGVFNSGECFKLGEHWYIVMELAMESSIYMNPTERNKANIIRYPEEIRIQLQHVGWKGCCIK